MTGEDVSYEITQHRSIGPIRGLKRASGVIQYLGVQYATLADRFARGTLLKSYPRDHAQQVDGALDATKLGPIPLSPENGCEWEQTLIQKSLPFPDYPQSDTDCLTLNIAVPPLTEEQTTRGVPVLALVHGGAFATGSSSYPQYDLTRIVELSVAMGKPMIAVAMNYRLGAPGFLYSSAMEDAGYKPNNGLDDQKLAFRWIQHHISGFGGDPGRVTCIGESAGGASGCFHLHSSEVLFHQLISMSGTSLLRPRPPQLLEKSFGRVVEAFEVSDNLPDDQVRTLSESSLDDLRAKAGRQIPLGPMVDGDMIPSATTYVDLSERSRTTGLFPGLRHCRRMIVGDCQSDSLVFANRIAARKDIFPTTLSTCLAKTLDPVDSTIRPALMKAYGLDPSVNENSPESTERVLELGNDICFAMSARAFAEGTSMAGTDAFLYRFNCPNPWDGQWKGYAVHIQDIAFVLLNYHQHLSSGQQQSAERFARDAITFVHGEAPWPKYQPSADRGSMVYDAPMTGDQDTSAFAVDETTEKTGRRRILQDVVRLEHLDKVMDAWQMFMAGPR